MIYAFILLFAGGMVLGGAWSFYRSHKPWWATLALASCWAWHRLLVLAPADRLTGTPRRPAPAVPARSPLPEFLGSRHSPYSLHPRTSCTPRSPRTPAAPTSDLESLQGVDPETTRFQEAPL